jgi:hypothetical protein
MMDKTNKLLYHIFSKNNNLIVLRAGFSVYSISYGLQKNRHEFSQI